MMGEAALRLSSLGALDRLLTVAAPMGYNSWYDLMCSPYMNETTLERTADAMIEKGLVALGYVRAPSLHTPSPDRPADCVGVAACRSTSTWTTVTS